MMYDPVFFKAPGYLLAAFPAGLRRAASLETMLLDPREIPIVPSLAPQRLYLRSVRQSRFHARAESNFVEWTDNH